MGLPYENRLIGQPPFQPGDRVIFKTKGSEFTGKIITIEECFIIYGVWCVEFEDVNGKDRVQPCINFELINVLQDRKGRIDKLMKGNEER